MTIKYTALLKRRGSCCQIHIKNGEFIQSEVWKSVNCQTKPAEGVAIQMKALDKHILMYCLCYGVWCLKGFDVSHVIRKCERFKIFSGAGFLHSLRKYVINLFLLALKSFPSKSIPYFVNKHESLFELLFSGFEGRSANAI